MIKPTPDTAWFRNWLKPIRVLLVEDNRADLLRLQQVLTDTGSVQFDLTHAERLSEALEYLKDKAFDLVLLALGVPDSHGLDGVVRIREIADSTPVVVLTSLNDERVGLRAVQKGAQDYLTKGELSAKLLLRAMRYAIERKKLLRELALALDEIKKLSGLLPICAGCKKSRDDKQYWNQVEAYIKTHSSAQFSQGVCPDCSRKFYPELFWEAERHG
jgi:DNA-binding response OmpR family regulator